MNGIIHNCTHANADSVVRFSEKDMMLAVFSYIDKLFDYIKPTKVFFMALDGMAPAPVPSARRSSVVERRVIDGIVAQVLLHVRR